MLFAGALSAFLPLGVTVILFGWALLGLFVALTSAWRVLENPVSLALFRAFGDACRAYRLREI